MGIVSFQEIMTKISNGLMAGVLNTGVLNTDAVSVKGVESTSGVDSTSGIDSS